MNARSLALFVSFTALAVQERAAPPASSPTESRPASRPASGPARLEPLLEVERFLGEPLAAPLELVGTVERKSEPPIPNSNGERSVFNFRFDGRARFLASTQASLASGAYRTQVVAATDDGLWRGDWVESGAGGSMATGACEALPALPLEKRLEMGRTQLRGPDVMLGLVLSAARGEWTETRADGGARRVLLFHPSASAAPSRQVTLDASEITLIDGSDRRVNLRALLSTPDGGKTEISGRYTFTRERTFAPGDFEVRVAPGVVFTDRRGK